MRISAQLIDGETGKHLWAERYDRDLEDIFAVQDDIRRTVVGSLEPELTDAEIKKSQRKPPDSLGAWDCYLRGLAHFYGRSGGDFEQALEYFNQAIEMEPTLGVAYSGAAETYGFLTTMVGILW